MPQKRRSAVLAAYGWLFAGAGAAFVLAEGWTLWALGLGTRLLFGPVPALEPRGPGLWLGLTGSLMAVLSLLAFSLAEDPDQPAAWRALIVSKAVSTALFCAFAARARHPAFLLAAAVDGSICLHLLVLRARSRAYDAWFLKLNDPATRSALWLRRTSGGGRPPEHWYVWFDAPRARVVSGKWADPEAAAPALDRRRLRARGKEASWDVSWTAPEAPAFRWVPAVLSWTGLAPSVYETPVSLARFSGAFRAGGEEFRFQAAPGCVGHLWGRSMAREWRWTHAVLEREGREPAVLEVLSARAGVFMPWLTCGNLWLDGRGRRSMALGAAPRGGASRDGDRWRFSLDFGDVRAEGECAPREGMTAELRYDSPDGRALRCRNSKTGWLKLRLTGDGGRSQELATADAAAVEFAEAA